MDGAGAVGWLEWPYQQHEDEQVPDPIRAALSQTLVQLGKVTFIVSEPHPSMYVTEVKDSRLFKLFRQPARQGTTRDPEGVQVIFDEDWLFGAAAAVVSTSGKAPPELDLNDWRALLGDDWTRAAAKMPGVDAVLRAGTDGAAAGWWSRIEALRDQFSARLAAALN